MDRDRDRNRESFRKWYENHKETFNARRRRRYEEDEEYADKQRQWARNRKRKIKVDRGGRIARKYKGDTLWVWSITTAAEQSDLKVRQIRALERKGVIPPQIFKEATRAYTTNQVQLITLLSEMISSKAPKSEFDKASVALQKYWLDDLDQDKV